MKRDWNTQIEPWLDKGLRIFGLFAISLEIIALSYTSFVMYNLDSDYPLPYIPAWMIPASYVSVIFKTLIIGFLIFGKWDLKKKEVVSP